MILTHVFVLVNKIGQSEKKPGKIFKKITTSSNLKFLHIKPVITTSMHVQPYTIPTGENETVTKQDEIKTTHAKSIQKDDYRFEQLSSRFIISDSSYHNLIWKTFANVLDRVFCLIHFVLQLLILIVYFKI